ncbi:hypothetical protein Hanom_Chr05g00420851 [Helianthus anomalus]
MSRRDEKTYEDVSPDLRKEEVWKTFFKEITSKGVRGTLGDPMRGPVLPSGEGAAEGGWRAIGEVGRGEVTEEGEMRWGPTYFSTNQNLFFLNKKTIPLRGECRHQIGVREKFKRGVDVA